jgi:histidinol dehydrogenase
VDRVFAVGGAGAIAALAYGTQTIPRVDIIVGPGNAWVTEAKLQVARAVAIDLPAGPSELLVLADDSADPAVVAREMLAQAEHDEDACVIALTTDGALAERIEGSLLAQAAATRRAAIVRKALASHGGVLSAGSREQAIAFANAWAPEHLLLVVSEPGLWLPEIRNAGAVFVGETSSVAFGDYVTGANHVLPTGGLARSYSGLSTLDFIRWVSEQTVSADAARRLSEDVALLANAEGLDAHARAAAAWAGGGGA